MFDTQRKCAMKRLWLRWLQDKERALGLQLWEKTHSRCSGQESAAFTTSHAPHPISLPSPHLSALEILLHALDTYTQYHIRQHKFYIMSPKLNDSERQATDHHVFAQIELTRLSATIYADAQAILLRAAQANRQAQIYTKKKKPKLA